MGRVRGLAAVDSGSVRVFGKSGRDCTSQYPELAMLLKQMDAAQALIDGEIVAFVDGRPSVYHVLSAAGLTAGATPAVERWCGVPEKRSLLGC